MEKELRIGNWINDHEGIPHQVAYLGQTIGLDIGDGATQKYQHDPIISGDINTLSPIPLDEDWLLDFGFIRIGDYFTKGQINVEIFKDKVETMVFKSAYGFEVEGCKFVHKLQNLYFELSDEELIRKQNVK